MFRRFFLTLIVSQLLLLAGLALIVAVATGDAVIRSRMLLWIGGATGLVVPISWILSARLARRLGRPIRSLIGVADKIGEGNSGQRVYTEGQDEIGELVWAFNRMSQQLDSRIARLEEDRQQLRTMLSGMVEGVVALDSEQRILYANERATQLLGLPWQAPVGRRLWEVVRQRPLLDVVQRALDSPDPQREELGWSGSSMRSLTVHAARLPGLPPRGAVLVLHDTTELRRLERLRQEFVANVSHELKTPLSIIKACAETLLDGAVDDPQHRRPFLEQLDTQSNRLHALILDLLSLARIESGEELFDFQPLPVCEIVTACMERHRPRAESKGQVFGMVPPAGEEALAVWADEEALEQILDNLLDNAVKYTPQGGRIEVGWRRESELVCLEVADTGIGIPESDLPRIFERFYRVDKARSREMGGTGLGLAIVKHLAQAMHGSVRAASRPGQGTTFTVRLPVAESS
ncbi:MAG TPA: ATP-binding protein [Gemmataceae bacterium]|jgi:two-component system phosphate regulon sensor histidine kinase PhoR